MSLAEQIKQDLHGALKASRKEQARTLRSVLAGLQNRRIAKGSDLNAGEEIKTLQSLVKQRKESIDLYRQGGRQDLVTLEETELEILSAYLPQMLSEDEIRELVSAVIAEVDAASQADVGKVMPVVMQRGAGRVDGKLAQSILRELLPG